METFPKANTANTVQQTLNGELLLYNTLTNQAFCLNQTSADIYNLCDGNNAVDSIAAKTNLPEEIVQLAISDLSKQDLLIQKIELQTSRRDLLRKAAFTAVALPVISTIIAPTAAHAGSVFVCNNPLGAPGGFTIGTYPSDTTRGLTVCLGPARQTCESCDYSTGPNGSICNNGDCTTATCYCAPVAVINIAPDQRRR